MPGRTVSNHGPLRPGQPGDAQGHARRGAKSPTYNSWRGMLSRCRNPNTQKYRYYGGRGIRVCEAWQTFANFLTDMGERPSRGHSIDRVDNAGHYSCGHCPQCAANGWAANGRWATQSEQCLNRRPGSGRDNTEVARAFGILIACETTTLTRGAVADMYGVHEGTVRGIALGKRWRWAW